MPLNQTLWNRTASKKKTKIKITKKVSTLKHVWCSKQMLKSLQIKKIYQDKKVPEISGMIPQKHNTTIEVINNVESFLLKSIIKVH